jgi:hypothetical protein
MCICDEDVVVLLEGAVVCIIILQYLIMSSGCACSDRASALRVLIRLGCQVTLRSATSHNYSDIVFQALPCVFEKSLK